MCLLYFILCDIYICLLFTLWRMNNYQSIGETNCNPDLK